MTQIKKKKGRKKSNNPKKTWLKVRVTDEMVEYAIDQIRNLDSIYGKENKTLLNLWRKFLDKKSLL